MTQKENNQALAGVVERVTFHNPDSGYCVLRVRAPGRKDAVTLVGHLTSVSAGEQLEAEGEWATHREFGLQFKAREIRTLRPTTREGIERYLGSGAVKGIGPHFAAKLVQAFGDKVFDVMENEPHRLRRVPGIGATRLGQIRESWEAQKIIREIVIFLQSHGISPARAARIHRAYGDSAIDRVREDPYSLAKDIVGIGFKSADEIAKRVGIDPSSIKRVRAGLHHILSQTMQSGHCGYPEQEVLRLTSELLEVGIPLVEQAVAGEVADTSLLREVVDGVTCLFSGAAFTAERGSAELMKALLHGTVPWGEIDVEGSVRWANGRLGVELGDLQKQAVARALTSKCLVITGGPGTGKTTLTRALTTILSAKRMRIALCSPTGRAAKRLAECTGMEAKTIHRLLGFDRGTSSFLYQKENPLSYDLFVVDEVSMVDTFLFYNLLKAIPPTSALLLVGDVDQLPSVGPGQVLRDLIRSEVIPTVRLTQIFRQAAQSQIVAAAHRINQGLVPETSGKDGDFFVFPREDAQQSVQLLVELVQQRVPKRFGLDPKKEIQVLCPMNRGGLGAHALNLALQKALNPDPKVKVERFGFTFAPGDKVMVTSNDYEKEVFNGDIGFIRSLDLEEQQALVDFEGREVIFEFGELDILTLAYAITIHKAQGSEYPAIVLPLFLQHSVMLRRNLLYTGVTRGKRLVVLLGQRRALELAVTSRDEGRRWTKLAERLRDETQPA